MSVDQVHFEQLKSMFYGDDEGIKINAANELEAFFNDSIVEYSKSEGYINNIFTNDQLLIIEEAINYSHSYHANLFADLSTNEEYNKISIIKLIYKKCAANYNYTITVISVLLAILLIVKW